MSNQEYKQKMIPVIKRNFDLVNPNTNFDRISLFCNAWSDWAKNNPKVFCGLFHGVFYLN